MRKFIDIIENAQSSEDFEMWNDKYCVSIVGDYRIVVDEPHYARYVTAWTEDNKKVGELYTRRTPDAIGKDYLSIELLEVSADHRGNGLGKALVKTLLDHLEPKWKGISSYLPDQVNTTEVPVILKRLGGYDTDDYTVIDR